MEPAQKPDKPWFLDAAFVIPLSIFIGYFWALSLTPVLPIHAAFRRRKSFLWKLFGFFR